MQQVDRGALDRIKWIAYEIDDPCMLEAEVLVREVIAKLEIRTPERVLAEVVRKMMHSLTEHDEVIADGSKLEVGLSAARAIATGDAYLRHGTEDVAEPQSEIAWTQGTTASASAEAATRSFMYGSAHTSTRSSSSVLIATRKSLSSASPAQ